MKLVLGWFGLFFNAQKIDWWQNIHVETLLSSIKIS